VLQKLGKYDIRLQIGRGAMGTVFEGFDPTIGRRVAIKTLRTEMFERQQLPGVLERFKREAQSAGRLSHPNVVTIHEYGEQDRTPYIVMEYIDGKELGHELDRGARFVLDDVVRIMSQLLGALGHAHENGVVHRDLKPANMFVLPDGSLKVVDFGIARVESSDLTETGAMLGTPAYMSPEQIMAMPVDFRSDLFSAGVILYQLLTGDKPFTGSVTSIMQKVLKQEPLSPSDLNPTLSPAWDAVISRAMAKKPEARYASAKQFADAIKSACEADRTRGIVPGDAPRSSPKRFQIAGLVILVAIGAAGAVMHMRDESSKQMAFDAERAREQQARQQAEADKRNAEKQAAANARQAHIAREEAERVAKARADELARKEADDKTRMELQRKQDEAQRKTGLATRAAKRAKEEAEVPRNLATTRRAGYDGQWEGTLRCGAYIGPGVAAYEQAFEVEVAMTIENGKATIARSWSSGSWSSGRETMSGAVDKDGRLTLAGEGSGLNSAWEVRFQGKLSDTSFEAKGGRSTGGVTFRECDLSLVRR
jgi:tRNA A-37 threonylcarbamoyl transferase component Bud32